MELLVVGVISFTVAIFCICAALDFGDTVYCIVGIASVIIFILCIVFAVKIKPTVLEDSITIKDIAPVANYYVLKNGTCVTTDGKSYDINVDEIPSNVVPAPKLKIHKYREKTTFFEMANKTEYSIVWE